MRFYINSKAKSKSKDSSFPLLRYNKCIMIRGWSSMGIIRKWAGLILKSDLSSPCNSLNDTFSNIWCHDLWLFLCFSGLVLYFGFLVSSLFSFLWVSVSFPVSLSSLSVSGSTPISLVKSPQVFQFILSSVFSLLFCSHSLSDPQCHSRRHPRSLLLGNFLAFLCSRFPVL